MRTLNWVASTAERDLISSPIAGSDLNTQAFQDLLTLFEGEDILSQGQGRLHFRDEAARFFANGGWLEDHVYSVCLRLKQSTPIHDVWRSLEVERRGRNDTIPNKLDVAFLADNRLYIIECKTTRFDRDAPHTGKGADVLYKLDTLTDLLGDLQARAILVSYQQFHDHDLQRASELGIRICCCGNLHELAGQIKRWVS